jgi:hypothetical protein
VLAGPALACSLKLPGDSLCSVLFIWILLQLAVSVLPCPVCVLAYVALQLGLFSGS